MAPAAARPDVYAVLRPVMALLTISVAVSMVWIMNWKESLQNFLMGPGIVKRIMITALVLINWKSMPFTYQFRVFYTIIYHIYIRKRPGLGPSALFKPMISTTYTSVFEIDYNLHKSNSSFFTDVDVSRAQLVSYLLRPAMTNLAHNTSSRYILDPKSGEPMKGALGVVLGSVQCSFHKEIGLYKKYELWSRVLCWDRKWLYILTHFLPAGTAKLTSWLNSGLGRSKARPNSDLASGWERKVQATAISKYVFKIGRLTVNPARILDDSGLLPERPGGWIEGSEEQLGDMSVDLSNIDLTMDKELDWRLIEAQRRKGMIIAARFHALDEAKNLFDGGENGALA
ncbi:uncharacterized protein NECHADRAFT_44608 [Fusarium vanettenii 77-13-4]|uniref:Capsule polysaccharide biosynthesis protein n=1 Tax=Fusarium vanettenii (strain ATCC MYA-4622 / CBS 123669 / FGSC 9596 / NRRL 45880 / 77-13-4) TaxID=660122 RepID=C7ZMS1_FUSV7|nr:uncharacterized protein NECHADRAFT_44608 [Fusarium vanettenii 77-13-4]EEU34667.1 hypothetical protein NECHADRAFT_44608 [Fusarium vanettenii 77-13-4]